MNDRRDRVNRGRISTNSPYFCGDLMNQVQSNRGMIFTRISFAPQPHTKPNMHCPTCQHGQHFVVKTESDGQGIRRRRQCTRCGHRWNTYEGMANLEKELTQLKRALSKVAELVQGGVR